MTQDKLEQQLNLISTYSPDSNPKFKEELMQKILQSQPEEKNSQPSAWYRNWRLYAGSLAACFVLFTAWSITSTFVSSEKTTKSDSSVRTASTTSALGMNNSAEPDFAAPQSSVAKDSYDETVTRQEDYEAAGSTEIADDAAAIASTSQKVIKTATYSLEVGSPATIAQELMDIVVNHYAGFVQDSSISQTEKKNSEDETTIIETAHLIVRVPSQDYESFRNDINSHADITVLSERQSGNDVTREYVDIEARITTLKAEEEQLQILLERAQSIEEILQVRSQLSYTRSQIEQLSAQMLSLDSQINYSTFTISLQQPDTENEPAEDKWSVREVLSQAWDNLIEDYQSLTEDIVNFSVQSLILIPVLAGLVLAVFILKIVFKAVFGSSQKNSKNKSKE